MAPEPSKRVRKRKPRQKKRSRNRDRTRDGNTDPAAPVPLGEVLNEMKKKSKKKKKTTTVPIPISDDPLEKNIPEHVPMPTGYVLVPKGDVYITRHCRAKTKDAEKVVYVVYNHTGKRTLGIRVPAEIHLDVLDSAAATKESRANAVDLRDKKDAIQFRALLKSEFPMMPKGSLKIVLEHAFLKGSGRVGRTGMISDEKKTMLAVEAHIRHVHTDYEKLLEDGVGRKDARNKVRGAVQTVASLWQGFEDDKPKEKLPLRPA